MTGPQPNEWLDRLAAYKPGRAYVDDIERVHKLSANESALGPSPRAIAAYEAESVSLHRYPDGAQRDLRRAIAEFHGLEADRIVCGAGSDEILHLLGLAFLKKDDEVVFSQPAFAMFPIIPKTLGATPVPVPCRKQDLRIDVDGILNAVTDKTRIVFIDNPNNPTGTYLTDSEIDQLHRGLPGHVLLVLDSAYAECVTANDYDSGIERARTADNVVMTRTFSKLYGLAALRIGWGYGPEPIIDALQRIRPPFNVTAGAQAAAVAALSDRSFAERCRVHTARWRENLSRQLNDIGLRAVPSQANFVLVAFPDADRPAADADRFLTRRGYLTRRIPDLADHLRITIGTDAEMEAVIGLLTDFMNRRAVD